MNISIKNSVVTAALAALFASGAASAFEPNLEKSIEQGKANFTKSVFGGNGKSCNSCHMDGGTKPGKLPNGMVAPSLLNAATLFPRFRAKSNMVVTLPDQIRACVAGAIQGTPPAYGSEELNSLASYVTSLSQGKAIDMGGKPQ